MIDLGRGIGRGGDLAFNQQGVFMMGGTFRVYRQSLKFNRCTA